MAPRQAQPFCDVVPLAASIGRAYDGFVTVTERVVHGRQVSEHFVQLCDSTESMAAAAAAFLAEAHSAGDTLLIVAREATWIAIHRVLTARGVDVGAETLKGRLIAMNAVTKLTELSRNGRLHGPSFETAIAE